jgi:fused signal recognition particle receptor
MFEKLKKSLSVLVDLVSKTELSGEKLDSLLWDFRVTLLENDIALPVVDQICESVKDKLQGVEVGRLDNQKEIIKDVLRKALQEILKTNEKVDLLDLTSRKRLVKEPFIIVFVGINGSGKTTTIGKIAKLLLNNGYSVLLAGSDTYRAGSIEQLEEHARRLGVRIIKHTYGSDAAAVAFDAISHARAHGINVVLIDTAGRIQTDRNLMAELGKVKRVIKPDLTVLTVDSLTGNDAVLQAEEFHKIYKLEVVVIPTNEPMIRDDFTDQIYKDEKTKFAAVTREIKELCTAETILFPLKVIIIPTCPLKRNIQGMMAKQGCLMKVAFRKTMHTSQHLVHSMRPPQRLAWHAP